ncbi:MAG TPA: hypothetical protein VKR58_05845 [Aquella sp.]|nr:hypothetical protein [Aquella sp.]
MVDESIIPFHYADEIYHIQILKILIRTRGITVTFDSNPTLVWKYIPGSYKTNKRRSDHTYRILQVNTQEELITFLKSLKTKQINKEVDFDINSPLIEYNSVTKRIMRIHKHIEPPKFLKFPKQYILETCTMEF